MLVFMQTLGYVRPVLTDEPLEVIDDFENMFPCDVEAMAAIDGDEKELKAFKKRFDKYSHGEWFFLAPEIHQYIRELPDNLLDHMPALIMKDPKKGYVEGNIFLCCRRCERLLDAERDPEVLRGMADFIERGYVREKEHRNSNPSNGIGISPDPASN